jgi:aryl-alcohol dehydrogenase-like predicted oxidoreductase
MQRRSLGRTGLSVSPLGFGAFKIGRNEKTKYPSAYALPDNNAVATLLNGVLDLGINFIDTAPAYGLSEERIGRAIAHRRAEFVLSTKVGETFADGRSHYDFRVRVSNTAHGASRSTPHRRARSGFIHSDGNDLHVLTQTDVVATLRDAQRARQVRGIGISGKQSKSARHSHGPTQ